MFSPQLSPYERKLSISSGEETKQSLRNAHTSDKIVSFRVPHVRNLSVVNALTDHLHRRAILVE